MICMYCAQRFPITSASRPVACQYACQIWMISTVAAVITDKSPFLGSKSYPCSLHLNTRQVRGPYVLCAFISVI